MNKSEIRKHYRQKRRALSHAQQCHAALNLALKLGKHPLFRKAQNIGFYMANDGEISLSVLIHIARQTNKNCFLPCTRPIASGDYRMDFRKFSGQASLHKNSYGIWQPHTKNPKLATEDLDLVLMPLVAFDKQGNRLGMGGGYYDRAFAFKRRMKGLGPTLIGVAHQCQLSDTLSSDAWDIPMAGIATDKGVLIGTEGMGRA